MDITYFHIRKREVDEAHRKQFDETWGLIIDVAKSLQSSRSLSEIEKQNLSQFLGLLAATTKATQYERSQRYIKDILCISPQVLLLSALCIDRWALEGMVFPVKEGLLQRLRDNADYPLLNSPFIRHLAAKSKFTNPFRSPFLISFWSETDKDSDPADQAAEVSDPPMNHGSILNTVFNPLDIMPDVNAYKSLFDCVPEQFTKRTFDGRRC